MFANYEDGTSRSNTFQSTLDGQPPEKQMRKTYTWRHAAKRSSFLSSRVSQRPSHTVGDRTLLQIWTPLTTLSIRCTASSSDRCRNLDSVNSMCTYNTVNKCILIIANKRIHIIGAYFLAAASDKCMRLLNSLYGTTNCISLWTGTCTRSHNLI